MKSIIPDTYSVFPALAFALAAAFLRWVATNMAQKNPIRLPNSTRICEIIADIRKLDSECERVGSNRIANQPLVECRSHWCTPSATDSASWPSAVASTVCTDWPARNRGYCPRIATGNTATAPGTWARTPAAQSGTGRTAWPVRPPTRNARRACRSSAALCRQRWACTYDGVIDCDYCVLHSKPRTRLTQTIHRRKCSPGWCVSHWRFFATPDSRRLQSHSWSRKTSRTLSANFDLKAVSRNYLVIDLVRNGCR